VHLLSVAVGAWGKNFCHKILIENATWESEVQIRGNVKMDLTEIGRENVDYTQRGI
jgi:hypothetical protein